MPKPIKSLFAILIIASLIACKTQKPIVLKTQKPIAVEAQQPVTFDAIPPGSIKITGETKKIDGALVSIVDPGSGKRLWRDSIRSNRIETTLHVAAPGFYMIDFEGKYPAGSTPQGWLHGFEIYLENDHSYHVTTGTDQDILYNHCIFNSNSDIQNQLFEFDKTYTEQLDLGLNAVYEKAMRAKDLSKTDKRASSKLAAEVPKDQDSVEMMRAAFILNFALKNPNTIVSAHKLLAIEDTDLKNRYADYKAAYDNLSPEIKAQKDGVLFRERLQKLKPGQN